MLTSRLTATAGRASRFSTRPRLIHVRQQYSSSSSRPRRTVNPDFIIYGIAGINIGVFLAWRESQNDRKKMATMFKHWSCSWENLSAGRVHTLITAAFSHAEPMHLIFNGFGLFFLSKSVAHMLGPSQFLILYLGAGVISCLTSVAWDRSTRTIGASGAVYGTASFLACVAPTTKFMLYGIVPVPAWLMISGLVAYSSYAGAAGGGGKTDHAGHLGGLLAGVGFFIGKRYRVF